MRIEKKCKKILFDFFKKEKYNTFKRVGAVNGISEYLCVYDCQNSSTVDILDPRITDAFLALTHEKYFERFGAEFGKGIAGFFTDEPQYFRYETAYTPVLLTEYKNAYGFGSGSARNRCPPSPVPGTKKPRE